MNVKQAWNLTRAASSRVSRQINNEVLQTGCYYAIVENDGVRTLCFAFQGTNTKFSSQPLRATWDWIINFLHCSVGGRHGGWFTQTLSIYRPMRKVLKDFRGDYDNIILTGFSQGAAIAAIVCDFWIRRKVVPKDQIYAIIFGGPRPFRVWYRPRFVGVHYVNGGDIVTRVPMSIQLYRHASRLKQLRVRRFWPIPSFRQHFPDQYREAISGYG